MHFSEIIKLQFWKKNAIHCFIFWRFLEILFNNIFSEIIKQCLIISEKCVVTSNFSFWIPVALTKICFSRIVINRTKILTSVLVGTVLKGTFDVTMVLCS